MDAAELMDARLAVREKKERFSIDRVKAAYGEKYDSMMMHGSKRGVANLLHVEEEMRSVMKVCGKTATVGMSKTDQKEKQRKLGTIKFQRECIFERCTPAFSV